MLKIWAKTVKDDKIVKDVVYHSDAKYDTADFLTYLTDICYLLDIPTPVLLKSHAYNFTHFNICRFKTFDFVEFVEFDALVLENATD